MSTEEPLADFLFRLRCEAEATQDRNHPEAGSAYLLQVRPGELLRLIDLAEIHLPSPGKAAP